MRHLVIGAALILHSILPSQNAVIHEETFDDNSRGWISTQNEKVNFTVSNGVYHIKNSSETGWYSATRALFCDPYSDFEISAKFKHISGTQNSGYGFFLEDERRTKDVKYNKFIINAKGEFKVFTKNETKESWDVWKDWTSSPVPLNPTGEWNTLSIHKSRGRYSLKINNMPVHYHSDGDFWGLDIGFVISKGEEVVIDDLIVKQDGRELHSLDDGAKEAQLENLGPGINTADGELHPIVTHDGSTLYFTKDANDDQQVFYAERQEDGEWSEGKDMGFPINNDRPNFAVSVAPDHNQIVLGNHYKDHEQGVSYTVRSSFGWAFPKTLNVENYYNFNKNHSFSMSPNRKVLFMVCEREDSFGEMDVYVSFLNEYGDGFTEPMNLGPNVNTAGSETTIFLAGDGTLYFSSNGHPGYGSNDIFLVRKLDDSWLNWGEPENLGRGINTPGWDAYFTIPVSGDYAYMTSSSDNGHVEGYGRGDIYRVHVTEKARPEPVVLVKGRVLNAKTKEPIEARITYRDLIDDQELGIAYSNKKTGNYQIILPQGRRYSFLAEEKGYFPVSANVDATELAEFAEIEKDLLLASVEVGLVVRLNNIFFAHDDSALLNESHSELDRLVDLMKTNPKLEIEMGGHSDDQGADDYNLSLSQRRVESVVTYLVSKSIDPTRFVAKGYGESLPVADNGTEEGRALNRRVEFTILKN